MIQVTPDPTIEEPMTRSIRMDARLSDVKSVEHVEAREIKMLPNSKAGVHIHNGPVVGLVTEGSALFQIEGQHATTLNPGDVFFEPANTEIMCFDAQEEGVTFMAYFLLGEGEESALIS